MVRRSLHQASYSLHRLRDWLIIVAIAATGVAAGACGVAAGMVLIGALGFGDADSGWHVSGALNTLFATCVLAAAAVIVIAAMIWLSDRSAPLMVRSSEHDRLHSRWGLRMTALISSVLPFVFAGIAILMMALGVEFG